jgi:hypothetical protein
MSSVSSMDTNASSRHSMSVSMYRGGRGTGRPRNAPPDLPSLLLDSRICYLGMPVSILICFVFISILVLDDFIFLLPMYVNIFCRHLDFPFYDSYRLYQP